MASIGRLASGCIPDGRSGKRHSDVSRVLRDAGASASFAAARFLILSLGGYSQAQFPSQASGATVFWQWSGYFSLTIRDRFSL